MRNVVRLPKPPSLRRYASKWTQELLEKIEECKKNGTEVPDNFFNKYHKNDIKEVLIKMYNGLCCYCEGLTGIVEFGNIEHRKPKKRYPEITFDWDNLHLACTRCNGKKGQKYSEKHPIIDAVKDKISEHMKYRIYAHGIFWFPKTHRGETTAMDVDLNEDILRDQRNEVFFKAMELIEEINEAPDSPWVKLTKERLLAMSKNAYGSVISYSVKFIKSNKSPEAY